MQAKEKVIEAMDHYALSKTEIYYGFLIYKNYFPVSM